MYLPHRSAIFTACLVLSGCSVTYNSPKISENNAAYDVSVVEMTPSEVARANISTYTPKKLPAAFSHSAGAGGSPRGLGSLPAAPEAQIQPAPGALALRLPPETAHPIYQIGIGDVILLATRAGGRSVEQVSGVFAAQSQQQGYTVRDDGAISIPEVGSVTVQGLTIEEAEERVFQRLIQSQFDAEFSLEVAEFKSKRVTIGGAVGTSTLVPVTLTPLTLDQALASAGGITLANQDFGSIRIYRGGELYQIPLETYFKDSKARKLVLLDGDSVYVDNAYDLERAQEFYERQIETLELKQRSRLNAISELQSEIDLRRSELNEQRSNFQSKVDLGAVDRDYVYLTGEVANQSRIPLPFETKASLADVFYENGGFPTTTGDPSQIYVLRANNTEELTAYHLNAKNIVNLTVATKFEMRPDDIIFVREQPITVWGRALQQAFPTLISAGAASLQ